MATFLAGCGNSGEEKSATEDASAGWHTTVVNGVAFDVMDGVELLEDETKSGDTYTYYLLGGDDAPYSIIYAVETKERDITGDYNVASIKGTNVFWSEENCGISFNLNGSYHNLAFALSEDRGEELDGVVEHTVNSLSF